VALRKARRAVNNAVRKAEKALHRRGVDARRAERERKKRVTEMKAKGEFIPIKMYEFIRDPEKNPMSEELESLKPHPSLIQTLEALQPNQENTAIDPRLLEDDIELRLERMEEAIIAISDEEDSEEDIPSGDDDSIESVDSIARCKFC